MDKRKLAKIAKAEAPAEMIDIAKRLSNYSYIVTAELVCDKKILLLTFFGTETLKKEKQEQNSELFSLIMIISHKT